MERQKEEAVDPSQIEGLQPTGSVNKETQTELKGEEIQELIELKRSTAERKEKKGGALKFIKSKFSNVFKSDDASKDSKTTNRLSEQKSPNQVNNKLMESSCDWEGTFSNKPKGILNIGNSCYMNALLQVLCWTPHLGEKLQLQLNTVEIDHDWKIPQSISSFLLDLMIETHSSKANVIGTRLPTAILKEVRKLNTQFLGNKQQDSYELFTTIISGLEDKANDLTRQQLQSEVSEDSEVLMKKSPVSRLFSGTFLILYRHETCGHIETTFQRFTSICVPVSSDENGFNHFSAEAEVHGSDISENVHTSAKEGDTNENMDTLTHGTGINNNTPETNKCPDSNNHHHPQSIGSEALRDCHEAPPDCQEKHYADESDVLLNGTSNEASQSVIKTVPDTNEVHTEAAVSVKQLHEINPLQLIRNKSISIGDLKQRVDHQNLDNNGGEIRTENEDDQHNGSDALSCTEVTAGKTRQPHTCFRSLQEPRNELTDLEKGLIELTKIEDFNEGLLTCKKCQETTIQRTKKRLTVISAPPILVLQMNKVKQEKKKLKKLDINVDYPFLLNMAPFCSNGIQVEALEGHTSVSDGIWYDLYGIICHSKGSIGYHYTAYVRTTHQPSKKIVPTKTWSDPERCLADIETLWSNYKLEKGHLKERFSQEHKWYRISDTKVTECDGFPSDEDAYILMYERI